jgi:hypothetical protein
MSFTRCQFIVPLELPLLGGYSGVVLTGRWASESILQKVLLVLPHLCVKMSEIGANQMRMVLIKISMISTIKRKTGVLSRGCKNA